jgi:hypothetical protein
MYVLKEVIILLYFPIKVLFIKQFAKQKGWLLYNITENTVCFQTTFLWQFMSVKHLTFSRCLTELSQLWSMGAKKRSFVLVSSVCKYVTYFLLRVWDESLCSGDMAFMYEWQTWAVFLPPFFSHLFIIQTTIFLVWSFFLALCGCGCLTPRTFWILPLKLMAYVRVGNFFASLLSLAVLLIFSWSQAS